MKGTCTLLLVLVTAFSSLAQKEGNVWYFGNYAGLDFSTTPPTVLSNGALMAIEGCASISDAAGNILFYTDGITVYNKNHVVMANGTGLFGHTSSTQSAIIVKQPGNSNIYYIFTQDALAGSNGFRYTIVDMNMAAGLGAVTIKNVFLNGNSTEKITAARHCNGVDAWIVTHDIGSNVFRSYLLTSAGINTTAVQSAAGTFHSDWLGQMKISPKGNKLGVAIYASQGNSAAFEVLDFDPSTAMLSNPIKLDSTQQFAYGCEFSSDGTKFYGATYYGGEFFQWDLCAGGAAAVQASVHSFSVGNISPGSFQLAPDGKIYVAIVSTNILGAFHNPNVAGPGCTWQLLAVALNPKSSNIGLPNFINSYFMPPTQPVSYTLSCHTASFNSPPLISYNQGACGPAVGLTGVLWDFGDPVSPNTNSSTVINPTHLYPGPGTYSVKLALSYACSSESLAAIVNVSAQLPTLSVAGIYTVCYGDTTRYVVSGANNYTWSTSAKIPTITVIHSVGATYSVIGVDTNNCKASTQFSVAVKSPPNVNISGPPVICQGEKRVYTATGAHSYTWSIGLTSPTISVSPPFSYTYSVIGLDTTTSCRWTKVAAVTVSVCVDVEEEKASNLWKLFPNPAQSHLTIVASPGAQFELLDIYGRIVSSNVIEEKRHHVDLQDLPQGVYFGEVYHNGELKRWKIIKD